MAIWQKSACWWADVLGDKNILGNSKVIVAINTLFITNVCDEYDDQTVRTCDADPSVMSPYFETCCIEKDQSESWYYLLQV